MWGQEGQGEGSVFRFYCTCSEGFRQCNVGGWDGIGHEWPCADELGSFVTSDEKWWPLGLGWDVKVISKL